jgi:uroporphyrinogen decarboxylase
MHELTEQFLQAGVNVVYPFEVQAGNDLPALLGRHRRLCAMGGMDKRAMAKDRTAMDREIERVAAIVELGRYVPFPDHQIPADVSWQNYQYFVWRWKEMIGKKD